MFVFSKSRVGMWYKLHRYNWYREEREPSCQQCLLTVLMAPSSHEWTWGQRDMWELDGAISGLGVEAEDKNRHSTTTKMHLSLWQKDRWGKCPWLGIRWICSWWSKLQWGDLDPWPCLGLPDCKHSMSISKGHRLGSLNVCINMKCLRWPYRPLFLGISKDADSEA